MIELRAMTEEEFRDYVAGAIPDYAEAHVRDGSWSPVGAPERARKEFTELLPAGLASPNHFFRTIRAGPNGDRVGELWYGLHRERTPPRLYVYWIGIGEAHRRKGYAAEAFEFLEREGRRLGASSLALHVFGDNAAGIALYTKLGFMPTNLVMAKPLA